jgi:uncharacterized protein YyaL (SSP411 family)
VTSQPAIPASKNRLQRATSPYLLQHAENPVDWYEWGPEAIERARREDKLIFLSIGYAACHWCHVMAHESFENPAIAAVMNKHFINIKVDREERPDIDEIYMQATMLMNEGQGGWPMSVWLTPELKPFYAGTYFPPASRWGRPGFGDLCERIAQLWSEKRDDIRKDADTLSEMVAKSLRPDADARGTFTLEAIDRTAAALAGAFDPVRGGLLSGGTNKFPPSMAMDLLLRMAVRNNPELAADPQNVAADPRVGRSEKSAARAREDDRSAIQRPTGASAATVATSRPAFDARRTLELVELTLDRMAHGGIYDHLAGGIARYSTDREWLVPHFEKMLYDQALVSRIYLDAWQLTKKPLYAHMTQHIFDYVLADLQSPGGGLYSSRDADSEGEEGKFYVWTKDEVVAAIGKEAAAVFCSMYDVSEAGNWEDPHAPGVPKNILHIPRDLELVAKLNGIESAELERRLATARQELLKVRAKRVPPGLDDKVLCEWNGLMIASLARGGAALGEPKYVEAAARAAQFILENQHENGRLYRAWRAGRRGDTAFLTDYAALTEALLELYEATLEKRWLDAAVALNDSTIKQFWDDKDGGFFFTPAGHETLIARSKDVRDGAVPSGNSVQLMNLLRLATIFDDARLRKLAERSMAHYAAEVLSQPGSGERFLQAVDFALAGPTEIAIIGDSRDPRTLELLRVVREAYLPNRVILSLDSARPENSIRSPLLEGRGLLDGKPAAYVCRGYVCKRPVASASELAARLREK